MVMSEIWKDIEGYQGYQVSNTGKVKSLNYKRTGREQELKPGLNRYGYYTVVLCKEGRMKGMKVHRLVAEAFITKEGERNYVDHLDCNKLNNHASNLRWVTKHENNQNLKANREGKTSSRFVGVTWAKDNSLWKAQIKIDKKNKYLGQFASELEAGEAYDLALEAVGRKPVNRYL